MLLFLRSLFPTLFLSPHPQVRAFYFAFVTTTTIVIIIILILLAFISYFFLSCFPSFYFFTRKSHGHMTPETRPSPYFWRFIPYYFSFSRLWQFNFVFKNFFLYFHPPRPYSRSHLINLTHFTIWFKYFHIHYFLYSSSFSLTRLLSFYLHLLPFMTITS